MLTCCWFLGALYANIRHDSRSEYNWWKSEHSKRQQSWGPGIFWDPSEGLGGGGSSLRKILGSKEHLDGLKIDLNEAETITVQDYE